MKDIIIVGANGFGREVLQWIKDVNKVEPRWNIHGFIDDNLAALDGYECEFNVIGMIRDWQPGENEVFVCAIALPEVKMKVINLLKSKGAEFVTLIHPTAIVSDFVKIGEGTVITPRTKISPNVEIGKFCSILGSGVGHDAVIGDYSTLSGNVSINGHVNVGKAVFIGNNACILQSKKVGDGAFVAIGSVVYSNVRPGMKVIGNPAKRMDF